MCLFRCLVVDNVDVVRLIACCFPCSNASRPCPVRVASISFTVASSNADCRFPLLLHARRHEKIQPPGNAFASYTERTVLLQQPLGMKNSWRDIYTSLTPTSSSSPVSQRPTRQSTSQGVCRGYSAIASAPPSATPSSWEDTDRTTAYLSECSDTGNKTSEV